LDPYHFAQMLEQLRFAGPLEHSIFPSQFGMPFTILLAIGELTAAVLVLVPRFRRWGAILASFLLLSFMVYMGARYELIKGADCSCFPILKRAVGPGFFWGDGAMLALAIMAGLWAKPVQAAIRSMAVIVGATAVFVAASYGVAYGEH